MSQADTGEDTCRTRQLSVISCQHTVYSLVPIIHTGEVQVALAGAAAACWALPLAQAFRIPINIFRNPLNL